MNKIDWGGVTMFGVYTWAIVILTFVIWTSFSPRCAHAQTIEQATTTEATTTEATSTVQVGVQDTLEQTLLKQIISLLQQQLTILIAQLEAQKAANAITMNNNTPSQPQNQPQTNVGSSEAQVPQSAPYFVQTPVFAPLGSDQLTLSWSTDVPVTSTLYVGTQRGDTSGTPYQSFGSGTSFTLNLPRYSSPTFYTVIITANGQISRADGQIQAPIVETEE